MKMIHSTKQKILFFLQSTNVFYQMQTGHHVQTIKDTSQKRERRKRCSSIRAAVSCACWFMKNKKYNHFFKEWFLEQKFHLGRIFPSKDLHHHISLYISNLHKYEGKLKDKARQGHVTRWMLVYFGNSEAIQSISARMWTRRNGYVGKVQLHDQADSVLFQIIPIRYFKELIILKNYKWDYSLLMNCDYEA